MKAESMTRLSREYRRLSSLRRVRQARASGSPQTGQSTVLVRKKARCQQSVSCGLLGTLNLEASLSFGCNQTLAQVVGLRGTAPENLDLDLPTSKLNRFSVCRNVDINSPAPYAAAGVH